MKGRDLGVGIYQRQDGLYSARYTNKLGKLTREQFDAEMEKGMADVKAGRVYSADTIEAEMKRDFGI